MLGGFIDTPRGSNGGGASSPARSAFNRWVSGRENLSKICFRAKHIRLKIDRVSNYHWPRFDLGPAKSWDFNWNENRKQPQRNLAFSANPFTHSKRSEQIETDSWANFWIHSIISFSSWGFHRYAYTRVFYVKEHSPYWVDLTQSESTFFTLIFFPLSRFPHDWPCTNIMERRNSNFSDFIKFFSFLPFSLCLSPSSQYMWYVCADSFIRQNGISFHRKGTC